MTHPTTLEIKRQGNVLILHPIRPSWQSLYDIPVADPDFLADRQDVLGEDPFLDNFK